MKRRYCDLEEPMDVRQRKQERLEQARIRLEQRARHIALQERKANMLEKKRKKEEAEKRINRVKKLFSLYYVKKAVKTTLFLSSSVVSVGLVLRALAEINPDARRLYASLYNKLNEMVSMTIHGGRISIDKVNQMLEKMKSLIRRS